MTTHTLSHAMAAMLPHTKRKGTVRFVLTMPKGLKARLDKVQEAGYSLSGFVRVAIEKALDELEGKRQRGTH